jgi:hypothetical protein
MKLSNLSTVVCLVGLAVILILGITAFGGDAENTPIVITVVGLIASTVPSLVAAYKSEQAAHGTKETAKQLNGLLDQRIETASGKANDAQTETERLVREEDNEDGRPTV